MGKFLKFALVAAICALLVLAADWRNDAASQNRAKAKAAAALKTKKLRVDWLLACEKSNNARMKVNRAIAESNREDQELRAKVERTERLHPGYYPPAVFKTLAAPRTLRYLDYVSCEKSLLRVLTINGGK